jgi:GNAT superfamily N-acetyltransferase
MTAATLHQPKRSGRELLWRGAVRPEDAEAVRALVSATEMFTSEEVDIAVELVTERLAKGPASGYEFVLADFQDKLAGYACYGPTPATVGTIDLYWIVVSPELQSQGFGRAILERAEAAARRIGGERLYVDTSSQQKYAPTRAFYQRTGFRQVAELPDFYRRGDGKVIFTKAI